jgi:hypothetical protein
MNKQKQAAFLGLVLAAALCLGGCGQKADENKPISEIQTEANSMDVDQLRSMALSYKDAILGKQGEVTKIAEKIAEIPVVDMLGEEAKNLKTELDNVNKSGQALTDRFGVYYDKVKEKGGDLSNLEIKM